MGSFTPGLVTSSAASGPCRYSAVNGERHSVAVPGILNLAGHPGTSVIGEDEDKEMIAVNARPFASYGVVTTAGDEVSAFSFYRFQWDNSGQNRRTRQFAGPTESAQ